MDDNGYNSQTANKSLLEKETHMTLETIDDLLKRAARLSSAERLLIARRLLEDVQNEISSETKKPLQWSQLRGMLPFPAYGEDAQSYISRIRRENTANRDNI